MTKYFSLMLLALVSGCSISKDPDIAGGSKVTGTVRLGDHLAPFQEDDVNKNSANATARRQCQQWGYLTAESYGSPISTCNLTSGSLCLSHHVILVTAN